MFHPADSHRRRIYSQCENSVYLIIPAFYRADKSMPWRVYKGRIKGSQRGKKGPSFPDRGKDTGLSVLQNGCSLNENSKNSLEILQLSRKTSAPPGQCWDIIAQISIDPFYGEGVLFVMDIEDMPAGEYHIQIPVVSICAIEFRLASRIHHPLNGFGRLIPTYCMTRNLPRFSAHYRHNVNIFPGFRPGLVLQEPVELIQFHKFCTCYGYRVTLPPGALFLSNSSHWICLFPKFFPRRGR